MSGIHQYIKDLDPILLYTFDPLNSFLDLDSCTGFYINSTETEFPPLELKNSGIYFKEPFLKFIKIKIKIIFSKKKVLHSKISVFECPEYLRTFY